ncbi:MAG TPA: hypothetical protein VHZ54_11785 [Solirubrobacterales bacterium]|jgi:hypothetical protein|nr:hypothetical protein [Solirubrobacterales bacterium]
MPETGYGSQLFLRACDVASACRGIDGRGPYATLGRLRAGSLTLARYDRSLPAITVRLTESPAGQVIGEHLAICERDGRPRYRTAQGVLPLPGDFAGYLRGRHRQAVRTNVGHARRAGLTATRTEIEDWTPGLDDTRRRFLSPGPVDWWRVYGPGRAAAPLAEAIVTVDDDVALLHGLGSSVKHARWLVHTAVVEQLCGRCGHLLVNSDDAYLLSTGNQHFQRLLGYEIARLQLPRAGRSAKAAAGGPQALGVAKIASR